LIATYYYHSYTPSLSLIANEVETLTALQTVP